MPVTDTTSYCVPATVPPMSASTMLVPVFKRLPVMDNVPAVPMLPGRKVPWLVSVLPLPTLKVPPPESMPLARLVNPPVFWKVARAATSIAPDCVSVPV